VRAAAWGGRQQPLEGWRVGAASTARWVPRQRRPARWVGPDQRGPVAARPATPPRGGTWPTGSWRRRSRTPGLPSLRRCAGPGRCGRRVRRCAAGRRPSARPPRRSACLAAGPPPRHRQVPGAGPAGGGGAKVGGAKGRGGAGANVSETDEWMGPTSMRVSVMLLSCGNPVQPSARPAARKTSRRRDSSPRQRRRAQAPARWAMDCSTSARSPAWRGLSARCWSVRRSTVRRSPTGACPCSRTLASPRNPDPAALGP
jgi:hypothetical protein